MSEQRHLLILVDDSPSVVVDEEFDEADDYRTDCQRCQAGSASGHQVLAKLIGRRNSSKARKEDETALRNGQKEPQDQAEEEKELDLVGQFNYST